MRIAHRPGARRKTQLLVIMVNIMGHAKGRIIWHEGRNLLNVNKRCLHDNKQMLRRNNKEQLQFNR